MMDMHLFKVSFRRKIDELGMLEPIEGGLETGAAHRPAQVYRLRREFKRELSLVKRHPWHVNQHGSIMSADLGYDAWGS